MNTIGINFRLTDFGESHGKALGGVIDGCPSGIAIDYLFINKELKRRSPSSHLHSTKRKEEDNVEFLSGIYQDITTGAPIGFIIKNEDALIDYASLSIIKPSHASYTYFQKYGCTDNMGCDRASARQTVCRVVAGAIAKLILKRYNIIIKSEILEMAPQQDSHDSRGALIGCIVKNIPAGLGEPVYDKIDARLANAMFSINACKGFEIGEGFHAAQMNGSQYNDLQNQDFSFNTNHDGGIQAGITNGQDICFKVAFKPIPSIAIPQETITFAGERVTYSNIGRNDLCVAPRVLPVVEAMTAITIVDFLLMPNALPDEK